jgi:osmotically-inducible protein OsmY
MKPTDSKQSNTETHTADSRNPDWDSYVPKGKGRTDEQIRADVHQKLLKLRGVPAYNLCIEVQDGVVTLRGNVDGEAQRLKLEKLVRSVRSVRELRDRLQVGN